LIVEVAIKPGREFPFAQSHGDREIPGGDVTNRAWLPVDEMVTPLERDGL